MKVTCGCGDCTEERREHALENNGSVDVSPWYRQHQEASEYFDLSQTAPPGCLPYFRDIGCAWFSGADINTCEGARVHPGDRVQEETDTSTFGYRCCCAIVVSA